MIDLMKLESLSKNDLEHIRHLQPSGWSDILVEFEFYVNSPFSYPIKTELNDQIVGIGASIEFDKTAWLAHIIVDPEHRRKGIGYNIVEELLRYLELRSMETCLLVATEMGLPIYEKAGFRIVTEYTYLKREIPQQHTKISDHVFPFKEKNADIIYKLDREVTGENREWLLSDFLDDSYVYMDNNVITGYYLPKLGEGLIIAQNDSAGIELLKLKIPTHDKIVLPSDNQVGIEFLKQNGFIKMDTKGTRMICGKNIDWQPKKVFSRIGGNLG